jgi:D-glycero-D-manno-heptose 1,7-bisphosphate phosphatase
MRKVVFLDRDGVINMERGRYTYLPEDFKYTPSFWENCQQLVAWGYDLIVITNQGGIAKGIYTKKEVETLNVKIMADGQIHGIQFLDIFYCPHHHELENCLCRKPKSIMLEKACAKHGVNPQLSYFVGDSSRDVEAGIKANITGVLIEKNTNMSIIFDQIKHG